MAASSWRVEFGDIGALENKLKQIPGKSEQTRNKVLHSDGVNHAVESIQPNISVSTGKRRVRKKRQAKEQNTLTHSTLNPGFKSRPT
ncbi:hypothetical protein P9Y72_26460, partial [Bacillus cereus]|nr:hypothetical protein [Bacillus cereus]